MRSALRYGVRLGVLVCWLAVTAAPADVHAQASRNPDVSVIGDTRAFWHNDQIRPKENNTLNLELDGLELAVGGYLNPYARADVYVGWHDDENAEIEEAYFTISRGVPLGIIVRGGQYLLPFGKINPLHAHAYSFINRPLGQAELFGHHGLRDVGLQASVALPTGDIATDLSIDILDGGSLVPHEHESDDHGHDGEAGTAGVLGHSVSESEDEDRPNERAFLARLESFVALGDYTSMSAGLSGLTGLVGEDERRDLGGADLKFKWKPDRYRSVTIGTEWLVDRLPHEHAHEAAAAGSSRTWDETGESITTHALFGYADVQFRERYNIGGLGDWMQDPLGEDTGRYRVGVFAGFSLTEESSLVRLLLTYDKPGSTTEGFWSAVAQMVFSLGPHKPHTF